MQDHGAGDQGFQYTSREYYLLTKETGITPSMSRRGNPYDNAMAENFFSIVRRLCVFCLFWLKDVRVAFGELVVARAPSPMKRRYHKRYLV